MSVDKQGLATILGYVPDPLIFVRDEKVVEKGCSLSGLKPAANLLVIALFLAWPPLPRASEKKTSVPFKIVYRESQRELQDKDGNVLFWIDDWARVHSPEVILQQEQYNGWVRRSFRTLIFNGASAPEGIELVSAEPPGRRGIKESGLFQIPYPIRANGVMTRDTISIPFYQLGISWNYEAHRLSEDCDKIVDLLGPAADGSRYKIDWKSASDDLPLSSGDDPFLLKARYAGLLKAKLSLRVLQSLLKSISTKTALGETADAALDQEKSEPRKQEYRGMRLIRPYDVEAEDLSFPPDWLTAQVDASRLPSEFLGQLHEAERQVQLQLSLPVFAAELRPYLGTVKSLDEDIRDWETRFKALDEEPK